MHHPYKLVDLKHNGPVKVDEEIADLVEALCDLDLITKNSCQDNVEDRVWISFYTAKDACVFLETVAAKSERLRPSVYSAQSEDYHRHPRAFGSEESWWVDAVTEPLRGPDRKQYTGHICIRISVRFPRKHLEEVTQIVVEQRDMLLIELFES